jgi:hypothetical protein
VRLYNLETGSGNFSTVYKGLWDGALVALKSLKEDEIEEFMREVSLLKYDCNTCTVWFASLHCY